MATRGAANRGGGPATFVGSVRKWELKWEETELPSYGAVSSNPGSAARRMRLLRWVRTGAFWVRDAKSAEREKERMREVWNAGPSSRRRRRKKNSTSSSNSQKKIQQTEERSDDGNHAAPRHPNLVPVEDASIPSWKRSSGGTDADNAPPPAAAEAAPAAAAAAAPGAEAQATPAAAANGVGVAPAAAAADATTGEAAAPMDAEGGA